MFVQVIQGRVNDSEETSSAFDRWTQELGPDATGWLGTTAGVTEDSHFVAVVRFASEAEARANSERPEQDRWWAQTAQLFDGEATFRESSDVDLDLHGDPDTAGFVQVMQGRTSDPARARELMAANPEAWERFRPDIVGSVIATHDDGEYTAVFYFTSEEEARAGERKETPAELADQMEAMTALEVGEPTYLDLRTPWLYSPRTE